jgi:hypothetical protein
MFWLRLIGVVAALSSLVSVRGPRRGQRAGAASTGYEPPDFAAAA